MRTIPAELAKRYEAEGWWTRDTLGDLLARGLERAGLARQKWPEEIHAVDDFPRTASGKVRKYILRKDIAARRDGE